MDAVQLKSFVAVAHEGNLTQTAKRLFLSQPAVSAQIKALEEYVGTPLFRSTGKGMVLTRAGEILLPKAESLLQYKHKLEYFAKTLAGDYSEETSLGIIHPIDSAKLVALTDNIGQTAPQNAPAHPIRNERRNPLAHPTQNPARRLYTRQRRPRRHPQRIPAKPDLRADLPAKPIFPADPLPSAEPARMRMDRNVGRVRK